MGYVFAVYNRPGLASDALRFDARVAFRAEGDDAPRCPMDCLGVGACEQVETLATPNDQEASDVRAYRCVCPANRTGAFCQDELRVLALDDATDATRSSAETRTLANGDWDFFALDPAAMNRLARRNASGAGATVLVELRKTRASRASFPLLYVKRGAPPAAFEAVYSPVVRERAVALDPRADGRSFSVLGDARNAAVGLDPPLSPHARVVGIRYDLNLTARAPSYADEACFAFSTPLGGYAAARCPSDLAAPGETRVVGDTLEEIGEDASAEPAAFDVGEDGAVTLELFEAYDDRDDRGFGRDRAPLGGEGEGEGEGENADRPPDATWSGTVSVLFRDRLRVGHDYQDVGSAYCTGIDCAVEDDHEVVFRVGGIEAADAADAADASSASTYYVGVYNSRVGVPGGGTLSQHESARYSAPMTYEIRAAAAADDEPPRCFRDCHGRGECREETAPACVCDAGAFGVSCGVVPTRLRLTKPKPRPSGATETAEMDAFGSARGSLDEGHFDYYRVDVPRGARALRWRCRTLRS